MESIKSKGIHLLTFLHPQAGSNLSIRRINFCFKLEVEKKFKYLGRREVNEIKLKYITGCSWKEDSVFASCLGRSRILIAQHLSPGILRISSRQLIALYFEKKLCCSFNIFDYHLVAGFI